MYPQTKLLLYLQKCDLVVYAIIPSSWRYNAADLTWPYLFDSVSFLIPVPSDEANIYGVRESSNLFKGR